MKLKDFLLPLIFLTGSQVLACKAGDLERVLIFEKNSPSLSKAQALELQDWYTAWLHRPFGFAQGIADVGVYINVSDENEEMTALARKRTENIIRSLSGWSKNPPPIHLTVDKLPQDSPRLSASVDKLLVMVQPACILTHVCCPLPFDPPAIPESSKTPGDMQTDSRN